MHQTIITERTKRLSRSRIIAVIILGGYFVSCAFNQNFSHFIDGVDLIFHEAGHWIFMFFGEFIQVLGGSLSQVLVPLLFFGYFILRKEHFSASILLMWVGYNVVNVSYYMADAVTMRLPLLGGDNVVHDWNYLLASSNLLGQTHPISLSVLCFGMIVITVGIISGLYFSIAIREDVI